MACGTEGERPAECLSPYPVQPRGRRSRGVCVSAGVSSLISLLVSAREEDQPRLNVLLCEGVLAVYLALLIHGLGTHSSNELFRLAAHPLNNRMWAAVFGGGAKVVIKPKRPEAPPGKP